MIADAAVPGWEMAKGVMLTLITAGTLTSVKIMFSLRDIVRDHERDINGKDGQNGLKRAVAAHDDRLDQIEDRNLLIDEIKKHEHDQYGGEERRHSQRRLRDILNRLDKELPPDETP